MKRLSTILILAFVISFVLGSAGCGSLAQVKRKYLNDPIMQPDRGSEGKKLDNHIFERREGSSGGTGTTSGGCGC
ncbi:MAG: DUF4266 domain-containing protein [Chitinispirillaceae bacterium]|nr:DUF4266 domain-containing protein [Chitinispirillaceae bacterium]